MTYTQEELDAECKRHFQMGINSAKADGRVAYLKSQLRNIEGMNSNLVKKVSDFENAVGCNLGLFKDKSTINLLKHLLEIKGDSKKIEQLIEATKAIKAASDMIGQEMSTLLKMPGVSIPYDERYDY